MTSWKNIQRHNYCKRTKFLTVQILIVMRFPFFCTIDAKTIMLGNPLGKRYNHLFIWGLFACSFQKKKKMHIYMRRIRDTIFFTYTCFCGVHSVMYFSNLNRLPLRSSLKKKYVYKKSPKSETI